LQAYYNCFTTTATASTYAAFAYALFAAPQAPPYLRASLLLYNCSPPYSLALANYISSSKPAGLSSALVVDIAAAACTASTCALAPSRAAYPLATCSRCAQTNPLRVLRRRTAS
jgi:hypothetical protein